MLAKNQGVRGAVNPVDFVISIVIVIIVISAVAIPTIQDVLKSSNITGIANTVLSVVPTFLALLALVLIARGL
jgi:predicted ATP-grasp superfamily ATP-dependent carboligase